MSHDEHDRQPLVVPSHALAALTGVKRPSAQVRWLQRQEWVFFLDAKGHPKVSTAYFLARMSGTLHIADAQRIEPRLALFN
jgi:hypothetical protein